MRLEHKHSDNHVRSYRKLNDILRFLSLKKGARSVKEVAEAVNCTLTEASKALSLLASIGLIVLNESTATLDPNARELLEDEIV